MGGGGRKREGGKEREKREEKGEKKEEERSKYVSKQRVPGNSTCIIALNIIVPSFKLFVAAAFSFAEWFFVVTF